MSLGLAGPAGGRMGFVLGLFSTGHPRARGLPRPKHVNSGTIHRRWPPNRDEACLQ